MQYRMLIKKVQDYSGFSDSEAENALKLVVEKIATRLTGGERKDFASELPKELEDLAMASKEPDKFGADDMFKEISELQDIDVGHAKKQVMAVWRALKDAITPGEIADIKAQLPRDLSAVLH